MRKNYIRLLLVICLMLLLSACGANSQEELSVADDADYTRITTNNGEDFYVDDKVVQVDDTQAVDAKKITDAVESYVLTVLDGPYRGRIGVVDGDFISAPGLEQELDARIKYIAATEKNQNISECDPYLRFETFDIQDDCAKVIVSFELRNSSNDEVIAENHEGYIFVKDGKYWKLENNIVDTGKGGADILRQLADNKDAQVWRTEYSYTQLKRSDYEDAYDYSYYVNENGEVDIEKS